MKGPIYYGGVWGQGGLIGEGGPIPICAAMCCPSRNADKKVEPAAEGSNSHLRGICPTYTDVSRAFLLIVHHLTFSAKICVEFVVGPLQRVRPRNGILCLVVVVVLVVVVPLRSEFIGEL